jgi:hypothetical protein
MIKVCRDRLLRDEHLHNYVTAGRRIQILKGYAKGAGQAGLTSFAQANVRG